MEIIDAHLHIRKLSENFAPLHTLAKRLNYDKFAVLSLQCMGDLLQNLCCALCKIIYPGMAYAFGGFDYKTKRDFLAQAKNLRAIGFDGIKMLESKPTARKMLKVAVNDAAYDEFYSYAEETGFPILFHVADPPEFWDKEKVPSWALERGWFYDGSHEPFERYYGEVDDMLAKHPRLRAIFAHFYFLSGDPERAQKFLDAHPSVSIDVTAGIEMYENFSKAPQFWREFFIKNRRRIIFGTDSTDSTVVGDGVAPGGKVALDGYAAMEIEFLARDDEIEIFGDKLHGLGLPEEAMERIFAQNYQELAGTAPQPVDAKLLLREAEFIRGYLSGGKAVQDLDCIIGQIRAKQ